jgi:hypothetical protein
MLYPKPEKRPKKSKPTGIKRGGKAPRKAGIKQESNFVNRYNDPEDENVTFKRVIASGAFGGIDPTLRGDIKGEVYRKRFLLESKAWATVNAAGEKTVHIPLSVLDKIRKEADFEIPPRHAGVVFHPMNTNRWIAIFDWDDFYTILREQEEYIAKLEAIVNSRTD